jgi:pyruvate ferredoxin oxidoreductase beta subunit
MQDNLFKINETEYILPGSRACQGCGLTLAYRHMLKALRENTVLTIPASCLCVLHGLYPITPVTVPCLNTTFASTAASASGIAAGLRALNKTDITVVAMAGDGSTYDMGIQALSGAAERTTDFIYVCYDNEGYMNTGTQRSSATPMGAITTTTPILTKEHSKKDFVRIMEAHELPYLATTSPAYPIDLYEKFVNAKRIKEPVHAIYSPARRVDFPAKDTSDGPLAWKRGSSCSSRRGRKFRFTEEARPWRAGISSPSSTTWEAGAVPENEHRTVESSPAWWTAAGTISQNAEAEIPAASPERLDDPAGVPVGRPPVAEDALPALSTLPRKASETAGFQDAPAEGGRRFHHFSGAEPPLARPAPP